MDVAKTAVDLRIGGAWCETSHDIIICGFGCPHTITHLAIKEKRMIVDMRDETVTGLNIVMHMFCYFPADSSSHQVGT